MAFVDIRDLSFTYPESAVKALDRINVNIERGEFVTLMGATGSGKTTLLRLLKPELRLNGDLKGDILLNGADISSLSQRESALGIGFVAQNPEEQIVTDKVWHELAFTLENLGADRGLTARRIAEISSFFDIDTWLDRNTATLSGGQKQLLNLAAVMTADPELLVLDEPTAQLDPIASARLIEAVYRLNRETGVTVIISEHRAEELLPRSDRLIILENGRVTGDGSPRKVAAELPDDSPYLAYMPTAARIFKSVKGAGEAPLNVREGQAFIRRFDNRIKSLKDDAGSPKTEPALEMKSVFFRYEKNGADILNDLDLNVYSGEIFALLGANGAGKSTAASVAAGLRKPYSGSVNLFGKRLKEYKNGSLYDGSISLLPQDVESVFIRETVGEELKGCDEVVRSLPYDLSALYDRHPYDISGGERQLVALCKALSTEPRLIIMDEPSKGLDVNAKSFLSDVIKGLKNRGVTVLLISHDVEFAALCADRCAMFSQGRIAACDTVERFMSENRFYTTAASRITRDRYDGAYTAERAVKLIELNGGTS